MQIADILINLRPPDEEVGTKHHRLWIQFRHELIKLLAETDPDFDIAEFTDYLRNHRSDDECIH
jgi:hypothetical protein